jgi:tetratricopeptide (TPR) repeat protein
MIKKIGCFLFGGLLFVSCGSNASGTKQEIVNADSSIVVLDDCTNLLNEAKRLDNILLKATVVNNDIAEKAMTAFSNFSSNCKKDSLSPVFLVKAGQVAQSIKNYKLAKSFFEKCTEEFPQFKNRGAALFLLAQLYDDAYMLNNEQEAKSIYEKIIKEYPNTPFGIDSKNCLKNLGKTDEQLVEEFLKMNK